MGNFREVGGSRTYKAWGTWDVGDFVAGKFTSTSVDQFGKNNYSIVVTETNIDGVEIASTLCLNANGSLDHKMESVEKGRFLIKKLGCNDCHTGGYLQSKGNIPENKWLTGDTIGWRGPLGTSYGLNLRLLFDNLKEEEWVEMAKTLTSKPPMPHTIINAMNNEDLKAVYWFIRYLGPNGKPVPAFEPHS